MVEGFKINELLTDLKDHRVNRTKLHSMENIIFISMAAVICGAETWNEIQDYGQDKEEWLKNFLDLSNGIPSHDTFNRFFSTMDPEHFESCFRKWVSAIVKTIKDDIVSIDGKTIKGNRMFDQDPIHVVSAWSNRYSLSLGQLKTHDKSNEITIIPELLDSLDLEGSTITIDAMGCQTDIATKIIDKKANYVLAVKNNHRGLNQGIIDSFRFLKPEEIFIKEDFDHGRIEKRTCTVIKDLSMIDNNEQWTGIKSIIRIDSERIIKTTGEVENSTRYYISSLDSNAENIAYSVRSHWGVENNLHWMLDVAFGEDNGRRRNKNSAMNFSLMNKMALMILNKDTITQLGVKSRRKKANRNNEYLLGLLKIE